MQVTRLAAAPRHALWRQAERQHGMPFQGLLAHACLHLRAAPGAAAGTIAAVVAAIEAAVIAAGGAVVAARAATVVIETVDV